MIDEVCDIVGHHHHPREDGTINFRALYDADLIVNLEETNKKSPMSRKKLEDVLNKSFLTATGVSVARRVFGMFHDSETA
jgi:hypothetical protein